LMMSTIAFSFFSSLVSRFISSWFYNLPKLYFISAFGRLSLAKSLDL